MILSPIDGLRAAWENLNDRERKLVGLLGTVAALFVVLLPFWLVTTSIGEIEDENAEIRTVLRSIARSQAQIAEAQATRAAAEERYERPAPPLGGFLEGKARGAGYASPLQVTDQPDKVAGGYTRRHVRASLPGIQLRAAIDMLAAVENSGHPIAVEQVYFDHTTFGQDRFNLQVGVYAFQREAQSGREPGSGPAKRPGGRVGPPAPR